VQWSLSLWVGFVLAGCSAKSAGGVDSATDSGGAGGDGGGTGTGPAGAPELGTAVFDVTGGPYDLALHADGRVFCSVSEARVVAWDGTSVVEVTDDLGPVLAIALVDDTLYFTTSLHQQQGSLGRMVDGDVEIIATAHGSTVFREPVDLARAPDGTWVMPDPTIGVLWTVTEDGVTGQLAAGSSAPTTVVFDASTLYIGGADGIYQMSWPDGAPTVFDDRAANGLHVALGSLWATNADDHLFVPGTDTRYAVGDAAVPARMAGSGPIYIADWGRADVWAVEP
jgi:hypothetical protein